MCFRALLYAVSHRIRIGFEGSKLKIVDQKASDGRVSQIGFQFLRGLHSVKKCLVHVLRAFLGAVRGAPARLLGHGERPRSQLVLKLAGSRKHGNFGC